MPVGVPGRDRATAPPGPLYLFAVWSALVLVGPWRSDAAPGGPRPGSDFGVLKMASTVDWPGVSSTATVVAVTCASHQDAWVPGQNSGPRAVLAVQGTPRTPRHRSGRRRVSRSC